MKVVALLFLAVFCGFNPAVATARENSGLAFGLNGISDWSTQHPFIDIMKTARPWIGHLPGQWGGVEFDDLRRDGALDASGWPEALPPRVTKLETLILTDQPPEAVHLAGRYHVFFDGSGDLQITGRGRIIERTPGHRIFAYQPGPGAVGVAISATDPDDPIRNIRVIKEEHLDLFQNGALFNPDWTKLHADTGILRFMDWMDTNESEISDWDHLPLQSDFSYAWRGVPLTVMIALANQINADPWFTLPHLANDAMVRRFATTVFESLEPERTAYIEYSNEVWNFIFEQAHWAGKQAEERWTDTGDGWMQFYGLRAAEVMETWADIYGPEMDQRLVRVVSVHTGWPGLEQSILYGSFATDALGYPPAEAFDAYAVTGYFGYELGEQDAMHALLDAAEATAHADGVAVGLSRVALREYVAAHQFDGLSAKAAQTVRNGTLRELTETLWPYHASAAAAAGLDLIMYEGGTHAAPMGEAVEDERLVRFLTAFNYSDDMGALYSEALAAWTRLTDSPFNAFVDIAPPSKWGSWGALRHLNDASQRWDALRAGLPQ